MTPRLIAALVMASFAASCAPPPYPDAWGAQAVVMGPWNSEPWVGTWTPTSWYQSANKNQPFQTPNSLPVGAWSKPGH